MFSVIGHEVVLLWRQTEMSNGTRIFQLCVHVARMGEKRNAYRILVGMP
jgi:hypothetical protein